MATQQRLTSPEFFALCSRLSSLHLPVLCNFLAILPHHFPLLPLPPLPAPSQPSTTSCFRYVQRSAKQVVPVASQVPAGGASLPANLEHVLAPLPSSKPGPSHRFAFILPAVQEQLIDSWSPTMACVGRDLKLQPPCWMEGHQPPYLRLDQAARGPIQPGPELLQGWTGHPQPLWAAVPAPHHSLCKELPPDFQPKSSLHQLQTIFPCPATIIPCKELTALLFVVSF